MIAKIAMNSPDLLRDYQIFEFNYLTALGFKHIMLHKTLDFTPSQNKTMQNIRQNLIRMMMMVVVVVVMLVLVMMVMMTILACTATLAT